MTEPAKKYKLTYFNARARAEPIRWMLVYAGVQFEDIRLKDRPEAVTGKPNPEWNALKSHTPFGTLPVLEIDGQQTLGETTAIGRYIAREHGMAANHFEAAQSDSIVTYIDSVERFQPGGMTPEAKAKFQTHFYVNIDKVAGKLEQILEKNNSPAGKSFFVGQAPTMSDFFAVSFYEIIEFYVEPGRLARYKLLTTHRELIRGLPGVKEFLEKTAHLPN